VVWFDFRELCGGPRSQNDYLELATQFHTMLLSGVPQMSPRLARRRAASPGWWTCSTTAGSSSSSRRRSSPRGCTPKGPLAHEFPRTVSRLREMRSVEYLAAAKRTVDTALT
jgi:cell division protein ZapE